MRHILVFGATSAIAARVIATWAARGDRLHLIGRDPVKLAAVAAACATAGGLTTAVADLGALERVPAVVDAAVAALDGRVDLVFVAHGDLGDQLRSEREPSEAERLLRINLLSVVALLVPLATLLERQRSGAIAVITSVAGERGRPRRNDGLLRAFRRRRRSKPEHRRLAQGCRSRVRRAFSPDRTQRNSVAAPINGRVMRT